nr:hypothetical protein [Candidatus Sigynarchaeota archaeon]
MHGRASTDRRPWHRIRSSWSLTLFVSYMTVEARDNEANGTGNMPRRLLGGEFWRLGDACITVERQENGGT